MANLQDKNVLVDAAHSQVCGAWLNGPPRLNLNTPPISATLDSSLTSPPQFVPSIVHVSVTPVKSNCTFLDGLEQQVCKLEQCIKSLDADSTYCFKVLEMTIHDLSNALTRQLVVGYQLLVCTINTQLLQHTSLHSVL